MIETSARLPSGKYRARTAISADQRERAVGGERFAVTFSGPASRHCDAR